MNVSTLTRGDIVTYHSWGREYRATYLTHNDKFMLIDVDGVTLTVPWGWYPVWVGDRVTDQAFVLGDEDVLVGVPPEPE